MKKIQTWSWTHGRDGFSIALYESSYWGKIISDIIEASDMDWWGKYNNIPFCWINPWGWTWHIGPEDHSLGDLWMFVGHKLLNLGFRLEKSKLIMEFPISDEEVKSKYPDTWDWAHYWHQEDVSDI